MLINHVRAILDHMQIPYDDTVSERKDILMVTYQIPSQQADEARLIPIAIYSWTPDDNEEAIRLTIESYIHSGQPLSENAYAEIASINRVLPQAKLFVDDDGDVGLALDIGRFEVNNQSLKHALERLARWADHLLPRLEPFFNS